MSHFADDNDTVEVDVSECKCPGAPHKKDIAVVRVQLGYAAFGRIAIAPEAEATNGVPDPTAAERQLLLEAVKSWNFLGPDGKPWPVSAQTIAQLDAETIRFLSAKVDEYYRARATLPNAFAGKSRAGSRARRSQTRGAPAQSSSTTSS